MSDDRIPVLVDTDIGSGVDDLLALLAIFGDLRIELAGIMPTYGDKLLRARIAKQGCNWAGIKAPITAILGDNGDFNRLSGFAFMDGNFAQRIKPEHNIYSDTQMRVPFLHGNIQRRRRNTRREGRDFFSLSNAAFCIVGENNESKNTSDY